MKAPLSALAATLFAGLLLYLLVNYSGLTTEDLTPLLKSPSVLALCGILAASFGHMTCSALKWHLIVRRIAPAQANQAGHTFFLFYTTLSAALAQFVMVHLASLLVRGLAMRIHHRVPFVHGAATSIFEQLFDVYVLLLFAICGVIAWYAGLTPASWPAVVIIVVVAGWFALFLTLRMLQLHSITYQGSYRILRSIAGWLTTCRSFDLLDAHLVLRLYGLSVLRYFFMALRMFIVVVAVAPAIDLFDAVIGFTVVQTSQLIAVTPGSLGITEWTWAGYLSLLGYSTTDATAFSLALRILSYASILAVLCLAGLLLTLEKVLQHRP